MQQFIFNNFWIAFIIVTVANAFIFRFRSAKYIQVNPDLAPGYQLLFRGFLIYGNIPWVIMGIGNLTGATKSFLSYLHPSGLNPMVLAFHGSIIVLWVLSVRWIYFRRGAEMLASHPGFFNRGLLGEDSTAKQIKWFFPVMLAGGILGLTMMWVMDFKGSHFFTNDFLR